MNDDARFGWQFDREPKTSAWADWPLCPRCRAPRQTACPTCRVPGTDFPLAELNPAAPLHPVLNGVIDPALVTHLGLFNPLDKHPDVAKWLAHQRYRPAGRGQLGGKGRVEVEPLHDARIRAFSVTFDTPLQWHGVLSALEMLQAFRAQNLLRMKALINVVGKPNPVVLHGVQHLLYPPVELPGWPDEDRRSRFVFITSDLDEAFVSKLLTDFTQAAST